MNIKNKNKQDIVYKEILLAVKRNIRKPVQKIKKYSRKVECTGFGFIAATCALLRLETSFQAACILIPKGYSFEVTLICRLIIEQIAWIFNIYEIVDEKILNISPTKSITKLKTFLESSGKFYGKFYGALSEMAHIHPKFITEYIKFDDDGNTYIAPFNTPKDRNSLALSLLLLTDTYDIITEYIFKPSIIKFDSIKKDDNNNYLLNENRPILKVIEYYATKAHIT